MRTRATVTWDVESIPCEAGSGESVELMGEIDTGAFRAGGACSHLGRLRLCQLVAAYNSVGGDRLPTLSQRP